MDKDKLLEKVMIQSPVRQIHSLHKLILEECCENVVDADTQDFTIDQMVHSVNIAFLSCLEILQGMVLGLLKEADTVTFNYRGQQFIFDENSPLLVSAN